TAVSRLRTAVTTASRKSAAPSSAKAPPGSRCSRAPPQAKSPSRLATRPIISSPAIRTKGGQDWWSAADTAELLPDPRMSSQLATPYVDKCELGAGAEPGGRLALGG